MRLVELLVALIAAAAVLFLLIWTALDWARSDRAREERRQRERDDEPPS